MRGVILTDSGLAAAHGLPEPLLEPGSVLVRVLGVGVCGTDLAVASCRREVPSHPWVLGHEAAGRVLEAGEGVTGIDVGDLVALEPNYVDRTCPACRNGTTAACANRRSAGITVPGYMAEIVSVPQEFVWKAPSGTSVEDLLCIEPLSVAAAAIRRSGIGAGATPLVLGAGAQGLFAVQVLCARGFQPRVVDLQQSRVQLALELGARWPSDHETFTHIFDTTGAAAALDSALSRLTRPGTVTIVGESAEPSGLSSQEIVHRQLTIHGSFIYDHPHDFAESMRLVADGTIKPSRILRHRSLLDHAASAIWESPQKTGKTWIDFTAARAAGPSCREGSRQSHTR